MNTLRKKIGKWDVSYSEETQLLMMYSLDNGYKRITIECDIMLFKAVEQFNEDSFLNWLKGCF